MKFTKHILTIVGILIVAFGVNIVLPAQTHLQPVSASETGDKYDGDCTGHETAGRCADKCPLDTPDGTYHLQGYDKDTGAAICRLEYYHACPYADAVKADDPLCAKLEAQQQADTAPPSTDPYQYGGMK